MAQLETASETGHLIAVDKVAGTDVYNRRSEKLGAVDSVMLDKVSGRVAYAIMSFGGFLGTRTQRGEPDPKHRPSPHG